MDKSAIFNHFSSILDNLLDQSIFFDFYFQQPVSINDIIGSETEIIPDNINFYFGATRGCIEDEDYDWVVKFDINFDEFGSVCERERQIYNCARRKNLNQYFAETVFLGYYHRSIFFYDHDIIERYVDWCDFDEKDFNEAFAAAEDKFGDIIPIEIEIPLFAYRRANAYDCGPVDTKNRSIAEKTASPLRSRNIAVAAAFVREYGEEEYIRFSDFGFEMDINDLHCGNVGEIDGNLVMIDYGGYHSGDSYSSNT